MQEFTEIINKMDLIVICRSFPSNRKDYTFSVLHETFSPKSTTYQKTKQVWKDRKKIIPYILSDHLRSKLPINNYRKFTNLWKKYNSLLKKKAHGLRQKFLKGNIRLSRIEWKWICNKPKLMGQWRHF